jgi:hypothetical protein
MDSRNRPEVFSILSPTMMMTPGEMTIQEEYTLAQSSMALVKKKTMAMGLIQLPWNAIKHNFEEAALLMST